MPPIEAATPRPHASTTPAGPQLPEPSYAERVRTLLSLTAVATLSTLSRKHTGFPFGSLMPYALDAAGRPIFLISNMAMHTQNVKADARASLFVDQTDADGDPLGAARATLLGNVDLVPQSELAVARELYLARHPNSQYWVDFADFNFYRLQPIDVYYVGGFGVMGWVEATEYEHASPDPLAEASSGILSHMNTDHVRFHDFAGAHPLASRSLGGDHDVGGQAGVLAASEDGGRHERDSHQLPCGSQNAAGYTQGAGGDGSSGQELRIRTEPERSEEIWMLPVEVARLMRSGRCDFAETEIRGQRVPFSVDRLD